MSDQPKQRVDIHRKLALRRGLMDKLPALPGAFYVPFVGDGDIAGDLYLPLGNKIYAADIDLARVATAQSRLPGAEILIADCDKSFPFADRQEVTYSLADFDAYAYPYAAFRHFWESAKLESPCLLFFTDGERQAINRTGHRMDPSGKKHHDKTLKEKRLNSGLYFAKIVLPWFEDAIKPWHIVETSKYMRPANMIYWGAIIEKIEGNRNAEIVEPSKNEIVEHPYKFDEIKRAAWLKLLESGEPRCLAARKVGLDPKTPERYMKRYSFFAQAASEAEMKGASYRDNTVVNALFEAAQSGNVTAIQVWLYNRQPNAWKDRRNVAVTGENGQPIKLEVTGLLAKLQQIAGQSG